MAEDHRLDVATPKFSVVGVGASAGGITALQQLFESIPAAPDLAFVIVQHSLPDHRSQLAHLFATWTKLPVIEVADGLVLAPGHVYIAPSTHSVGIEGGAFTTHPFLGSASGSGIDTIDSLFGSLADELGDRAIAVVLSGTGSDGAAGAVRVKQAGGLVFVQDPITAMHDGMPSAAIANGTADHIMPLRALAQELLACTAPGYVRSPSATTWADDVNKALDGMIALIRDRAGFDLAGYKITPVLWRIQRRMQLRRVPQFRDYEALLHDDPAELESLIRGMPIHVTEFFRDRPFWSALEQQVIPELFALARDTPVRAWTPACSSGEEAYSVAMLLAEQAGTRDFQVFATDAAAEIVGRASRGVFKPAVVSSLSVERRQRFFYSADGAYRVNRSLREKMVFAPQDLLADPPFSGLDLITCRNLLIYLEPDAARHVVYLLHSALRPDGYLFLGKSESLPLKGSGFTEVVPNARIYRKTGPSADTGRAFPKRPVRMGRAAVEALSREAALSETDAAAVLVDDSFQIVRVFGDTSSFLRLQAGEPTFDLAQLLRPPNDSNLRLAAKEALTYRRAATVGGLSVTPVDDGARLLVSFTAVADASTSGSDPDWSEALRVSHAELEASREELQALNEELRASNDQLNVANDDLNSANAQLRDKLDELETQSNVLTAGEIMTLFLDDELRVRFYTSDVSALFPIRAGDVGRRITDLAWRFEAPQFIDHVRAVMETGRPSEREVRTFQGSWYIKRIRPFKSATATGVAITFTDITDRKRIDQALRESETALAGELEATRRLHEFSTAANDVRDISALLELALDTLLRLHRTDMGNIQLYEPKPSVLRIAAHRGFEPWFIEHYRDVLTSDGTACAQAFTRRERVSIGNVDAEHPDPVFRDVARQAGYAAVQSTPLMTATGGRLGVLSSHFRAPRVLADAECRLADILAAALSSSLERLLLERRTQSWLAAQNEAFQAAMNDEPLEKSLGVLVRAALQHADSERRCAFYVAEGTTLRHVVGMGAEYARRVDGFRISAESLACGLAAATGEAVITRDVLAEPRWQDWTSLARDFDYRGCWSFPIETATGTVVGSFVMYFSQPHDPTPRDRELAAMLTKTAAIIISRQR